MGKTWAIFMNRVQRELKAALFGRKANPTRVGRQRGVMGKCYFRTAGRTGGGLCVTC